MNSYASVDGLPCGGSKAILDDLLRGELGFTGAVVADYSTTELLMSHHRVAATKGEAARRALEAGLDMELPQLDCYGAPLRELVEAGEVDVALVDRSVRRVLELKDALGLFDQPFVDEDAAERAYARPRDRALAREAAVKSLVLLRNEGDLLPLSPDRRDRGDRARGRRRTPPPGRLLVPRRTPRSCSPATATGKLIERDGDFAPGPYYPESVTPLAGIRAIARTVTHAKGAGVRGTSTDGLRAAVADAERGRRRDLLRRRAFRASCPTARAASSATSATSACPACSSSSSKPWSATGTPTVVVVVSGRAHALPWIAEHVPALLVRVGAGRAGRRGDRRRALRRRIAVGPAPDLVAAQRRSRPDPSRPPRGRRPQPDLRRLRGRAGLAVVLLRLRPHVHDVRVRRAARPRAGHHRARSCRSRSTCATPASRAGTEVVQLFLRDEVARVARPDRQLAGFARVELEPGDVGDRAILRRPDRSSPTTTRTCDS